jgi:hypothetical protein
MKLHLAAQFFYQIHFSCVEQAVSRTAGPVFSENAALHEHHIPILASGIFRRASDT